MRNASAASQVGILVGGDAPGYVAGVRDIIILGNIVDNSYIGIYVCATDDGLQNRVVENTVHHSVDVDGAGGIGIYVWDPSGRMGNANCYIAYNSSHDNDAQGLLMGSEAGAASTSGNTLLANELYANGNGRASDERSQGLQLVRANANEIAFNRIYNQNGCLDAFQAGIYLEQSANNELSYNNLSDSRCGLVLGPDSGGNAVAGNEILGSSEWGVWVQAEAAASSTVMGNRIMGSGVGAIRNDGVSSLAAVNNYCGRSIDPTPVSQGPMDLLPMAAGWASLPELQSLAVGETISLPITFWAEQLYGFQAVLNYDTLPLDAVGHSWVDSWFSPDHIEWNGVVDEPNGRVFFAASQLRTLHPDEVAGDDQPVFTVTWEGVTEGEAVITFADCLGGTLDGEPIPFATDGTLVEVSSTGAWLAGSVELQGREDDHWQGAHVDVVASHWETDSVADGSWGLQVGSGLCTVYVEMPRYLDASLTGVDVPSTGLLLSQVRLLGGDANDDDVIDILDMAIIGGQFGLEGAEITNYQADINDDDTIDILDIVLAGGNYMETCAVWTP